MDMRIIWRSIVLVLACLYLGLVIMAMFAANIPAWVLAAALVGWVLLVAIGMLVVLAVKLLKARRPELESPPQDPRLEIFPWADLVVVFCSGEANLPSIDRSEPAAACKLRLIIREGRDYTFIGIKRLAVMLQSSYGGSLDGRIWHLRIDAEGSNPVPSPEDLIRLIRNNHIH